MKQFLSLLLGTQQVKKPSPSPFTAHEGKELELNKWVVSDFVTQTLLPVVGDRPFPLDELMLLTEATLLSKPDIVCDWGTHVGKSARTFYEIRQAFSLDYDIYSIDLPDDVDHVEHPHDERGRMVRGLEPVTLVQGDGVTEAVRICKQGKYQNPLFLLDGDHSYETVLRELKTIAKEVKKNTMLIHDTFFQTKESGYNIGPYQAIEDFLKKESKRFDRVDTVLGLPGMTWLYPKEV